MASRPCPVSHYHCMYMGNSCNVHCVAILNIPRAMCIVSHYTERWATNWSAAPVSSVRLTPGDKSWSATKKPGALLDLGAFVVLIESLIKLRREFCSSLLPWLVTEVTSWINQGSMEVIMYALHYMYTVNHRHGWAVTDPPKLTPTFGTNMGMVVLSNGNMAY